MRKLSVISGLFFAGAVVCFGLSQFVLSGRWAVLDLPIRVEKGFSLSTPFTVDIATKYEVEVRYARATDSQPPARDTDERREQATAFSVSVDRQPLVGSQRCTLNGNVYYSEGKPSCYLGTFRGVSGHTHQIDLRVNRDLPELAAMNPTVRVRVYSAYICDMQNASSGCTSIGLGFGFLGAICLLPRLLSSTRREAGDGGPAEPARP